MNININNLNSILFNGNEVTSLVMDGVTIWSKGGPTPIDYSKEYFTITNAESTSINVYIRIYTAHASNGKGLAYWAYKKNTDSVWTEYNYSTGSGIIDTTITVNLGVGENVKIKGNGTRWSSSTSGGANSLNDYLKFSYFNANGRFTVSGNIMSLIYNDSFSDKTADPTGSGSDMWGGLFYGLSSSPNYVYDASNLIIPETTLSIGHCSVMFMYATYLTKAPTLPASYIPDWGYNQMFYGCSSLTEIKCLATSKYGNYTPLNNWVYGAPASGTFTKSSSATFWPSGASGIPSGWTVIEE